MVEVLALRKVSQHSYVNVLELWFLLLVCGMMGAIHVSIPAVWCGRAQCYPQCPEQLP